MPSRWVLETVAFTQPAGSVAGGATSLAAALAGNPGAAMQASRAMSILALSACHFRHDVAVSFPLSVWPGFEVGPGRHGSYYRGAVVANVATLMGLFGVAMAICGIRARVSNDPVQGAALTAAMGWAKFPGLVVGPFGMLLTGTVASSVAAAAHGSAAAGVDASLAGYGLVVCAVGIGLCVYGSIAVTTRYCRVTAVMTSLRPPSDRCSTVMACFEPRESEWGPRRDDDARDRAVTRMFRPLFQRYRVECPWYYGFDATLTYLVAVAQGSMPDGRGQCLAAMVAVLLPCLVSFVAIVKLRPDNSAGKLWLHGLGSVVTLVSAVLAIVGIATESDLLVAACQVSAVLATVIGVSSAVMSLLLLLYRRGQQKARHAVNTVEFSLPEELLTPELRLSAASRDVQPPRFFAPATVTTSAADAKPPMDPRIFPPTVASAATTDEKLLMMMVFDAHDEPAVQGGPVTPPLPVSVSALPCRTFAQRRSSEHQRLHDELTVLLQGSDPGAPHGPQDLL